MPSIYDWSLVEGENATSDSGINWAEGMQAKFVNNSARAMMARQFAWLLDQVGAVQSAGTNSISVTLYAPPAAYQSGFAFMFRAANSITSPSCTLNVNGKGPKPIRKTSRTEASAVPLDVGDIRAGGFYRVAYDASLESGSGAFVLLDPALSSLATRGTVNDTDWSGADLSIANGGTGASSAGAARTNLGLVIDTDVVGSTAALQAIKSPTGTLGADKIIILTSGSASALIEIVSWAQTFLGAATRADGREELGLGDLATKDQSDLGELSLLDRTDLVYGGTVGSQTNLPIGSVISVYAPSLVLGRNESTTPRLDPDFNRNYRIGGSGDALSGDWRSSGASDSAGNFYNLRRVA